MGEKERERGERERGRIGGEREGERGGKRERDGGERERENQSYLFDFISMFLPAQRIVVFILFFFIF